MQLNLSIWATDFLLPMKVQFLFNTIDFGWAAFEKNKPFLTSSRIPYKTKAKIYNTCLFSQLLYNLDPGERS